MAVEYLGDPLPPKTYSEQLRRDFAWALVVAPLFGLLAAFGGAIVGSIVAAIEPDIGEEGALYVAVMAFCGGLAFGGWRAYQLYRLFAPDMAVEARWHEVLESCGLVASGDGTRVRYLAGGESLNSVAVRPPAGTDPDAFARKLPNVAFAWDVPAVEVYKRMGGWLSLHLMAQLPPPPPSVVTYSPEPFTLPEAASWAAYFAALPVGELHQHTNLYTPDEMGLVVMARRPEELPPELRLPRQWGLPLLGSHILLGGETGAGKSSWQQSVIAALMPAVAHGAAVLVGIDPKGVELAIGRGVFTHYASEPDSIAALLETMVELMSQRKQRMAGKTRLIRPTSADPIYVIMIDEVAPLTKLDPDAKRRVRVVAAMNLLLTQGRALGFSLVGAVQDPRKETVDNRDLFNIRVALKMPAGSVDVVLGPKCREEGANAHQLTAEWKGAGYLYDGRGWALVRAYWRDDPQIMGECGQFQDGEYSGHDWGQWFCPIDEPRHPRSRVQPLPVVNVLPQPIGSSNNGGGGQPWPGGWYQQ